MFNGSNWAWFLVRGCRFNFHAAKVLHKKVLKLLTCKPQSYCYSGGFLNPAVTIGVAFAGILTPITTLCYLLMQIVGAVTGAAIGSVSVDVSCY